MKLEKSLAMLKVTIIALLAVIALSNSFNVYQVSASPGQTVAVSKTYNVTEAGKTLLVNVSVLDITGLASWRVDLAWNASMLKVKTGDSRNGVIADQVWYNIYLGPFMATVGSSTFGVSHVYNSQGKISKLQGYFGTGGLSVSGSGIVAMINFTVVNIGTTIINITTSSLKDYNGQTIAHATESGLVTNGLAPPPPLSIPSWLIAVAVVIGIVAVVVLYSRFRY